MLITDLFPTTKILEMLWTDEELNVFWNISKIEYYTDNLEELTKYTVSDLDGGRNGQEFLS